MENETSEGREINMITRLQSSFDHVFHAITKKWTLVFVLFVAGTLSWVAVYAVAKTGQLAVHFFDVGQGDAIFIELPDGRQILIDGGPNEKVVEKLNEVMPFWDREIDMMIATHADADHLAGLVPVLTHYDTKVIIWNGEDAATKIFQEWEEAVGIEGAEVLIGRCCMRFTLSDSAFFEILYPFDILTGSDPVKMSGPGSATAGQNNYSLVIRFVYGNDSFLFTGDIERQAEYKIVEQGLVISSDVLKIAHHGSKTSSSELFLEEVRPKIAVISVGRANPYGHPYEAILQRLEKHDIEVRRTDKEGDIVFTSNGNSF